MKKNLTRLLLLAVLIAMLVCGLIFSSSAASTKVVGPVSASTVARVNTSNGNPDNWYQPTIGTIGAGEYWKYDSYVEYSYLHSPYSKASSLRLRNNTGGNATRNDLFAFSADG